MTYVRRRHECVLPYPHVNGDIWQCDECGKTWRASVPGNPMYAGWRQLGRLGRWLSGVRTS